MILADTTIWSRSLPRSRPRDERFADLLLGGEIACHPWVYGELLLAGVAASVARDIEALDFLPIAPAHEVYRFIRRYHPTGIGWVDVNLLVSCLDSGAQLWTSDKALHANAKLHGRCAPDG